jgi:hypothetical protein
MASSQPRWRCPAPCAHSRGCKVQPRDHVTEVQLNAGAMQVLDCKLEGTVRAFRVVHLSGVGMGRSGPSGGPRALARVAAAEAAEPGRLAAGARKHHRCGGVGGNADGGSTRPMHVGSVKARAAAA